MSCFGKCEMFYFNTRLIALLLLLPFGCSSQGDDAGTEKTVNRDAEKTLIVYLTRTNNTKAIAEIIHAKIGGTLVGLELQNPYPEDYKATVAQVAKENETGFLPPLKTRIENIESFDLIFVGFSYLGNATASADEKLSNTVRFKRKNHCAVQYEWWLWNREHL
jgi:hypothetical protein